MLHSDTVQRIFEGGGGGEDFSFFFFCNAGCTLCVVYQLRMGARLLTLETWQAQHLEPVNTPYAKKCACNMHVPTYYMHVTVNMHVTLLLYECYMHVVRVLEMVAHVPCMLYEC